MDAILHVALSNVAWSVALALVAAVGARVWRRRPAVVHAMWLLVLLKLVAPPLTSIPLPAWEGLRPAASRPGVPIAKAHPAATPEPRSIVPVDPVVRAPTSNASPVQPSGSTEMLPPEGPGAMSGPARPAAWPWRTVLAGAWLVGAAACWSVVWLSTAQCRRLIASTRPVPAGLSGRLAALSGRMGLGETPEARLVPARVPPMLWVPLFGRPRLLLPDGLWDGLDAIQQDAVLAHELTHLERRDHWVRRLEAVALGLYWWDPVAWWARRRLEQAEEECCDARVVSLLPAAAGAYAEALVTTAVFLSGVARPMPMGASGVGRLDPIKRRLQMILSDAHPAPATSRTVRVLLVLAVLGLPLLPAAASGRPPAGPVQAPAPQRATPAARQRDPAADRKTDRPQAPPAPADGKIRVKATRPVRREVRDYAHLMGRVDAAVTVSVRPRVTGMVVNVFCQTGQTVKRGDVLFQIDPRTYEAEADKAEAEVRVAQARLEAKRAESQRAANTHEREGRVLAIQLRDESKIAEASVDAAVRARDLARLNLDFTRLESPIDGMFVGPVVQAGNIAVADNTTLATLVSTSPMYVYFNVPENIVLKLNRRRIDGKLKIAPGKGLPVDVGLQDERDFPRRGTVESLNGAVDPRTGSAHWRARVDEPDDLLMPGLSANVRIPIGEPRPALLIPAAYTWTDQGGTNVTVVSDDGHLERRHLTTGGDHGEMREVTDGLKGDEWVVEFRRDILQLLRIGTKVDVERIAPPDGASSGAPHPR